MVPVVDNNRIPLMPCSEKRARKLMAKKEAIPYWTKGIFHIKLIKEPSKREYQDVALGIDPGSKREGYTVATKKAVVLNITSNTKDWVQNHLETRKFLRKSRRQRKTPYRQCRVNRAVLKQNKIPPSTKVRWDTKLQMIKFITSILPITIINIEDLKAMSKPGKTNWNTSFSPLQIGKSYFDNKFNQQFSNIILLKTSGIITKEQRDKRNFSKLKCNKKLKYVWEAHNIDSHVLCEIVLNKNIKPFLGLYKFDFIEYYRRCLHVQNPTNKNKRKKFGGTVSSKIPRGSIIKYQNNLYYIGGNSKIGISLHSIISGKRIKRNTEIKDIKVLYTNNKRIQFCKNFDIKNPKQG